MERCKVWPVAVSAASKGLVMMWICLHIVSFIHTKKRSSSTTYDSEILGDLSDTKSTRQHVGQARVVEVAELDLAVVERPEHVVVCLECALSVKAMVLGNRLTYSIDRVNESSVLIIESDSWSPPYDSGFKTERLQHNTDIGAVERRIIIIDRYQAAPEDVLSDTLRGGSGGELLREESLEGRTGVLQYAAMKTVLASTSENDLHVTISEGWKFTLFELVWTFVGAVLQFVMLTPRHDC